MKRVPQTPCVCTPVSDVPPGTTIPGGIVTVACYSCGTDLYAMSSTVALVRRGEAYATCPACVPGLPDGQSYVAACTAEQAEELVAITLGVPELISRVAALTALLGRVGHFLDKLDRMIDAHPGAAELAAGLGLPQLLDDVREALA